MQNEHESTDIIRIEHLNKTFGDVKQSGIWAFV